MELEQLRVAQRENPSDEASRRIAQIDRELLTQEEREQRDQGLTGDPDIDAWMEEEAGRVVDGDDDWKDTKVDA